MNDQFRNAALFGNLMRVKRMLADGEARLTDVDRSGATALLCAARGSQPLLTLIWLLEEGGARITDKDHEGNSALLLAARNLTACQWLLEHGGADVADITNDGRTIWNMLERHWLNTSGPPCCLTTELTALLRVMVLKGDPPIDFVAQLTPEHARVVEEGARLRAALPAYLRQRRALLDAHCPLLAPLLALVRGYNPEPTTTEELWATGLGAAPQRARRPRSEDALACASDGNEVNRRKEPRKTIRSVHFE
jgi:hypothetical protein